MKENNVISLVLLVSASLVDFEF